MNHFNKIFKALWLIAAIPFAIAVLICYVWFVFKSIPVLFHLSLFTGVISIIMYILITPLVIKALCLVINPQAMSDK